MTSKHEQKPGPKGPPVCVCDVHEAGNYNRLFLTLTAIVYGLIAAMMPVFIRERDWVFFAIFGLLIVSLVYQYVTDKKRYTEAGHSPACIQRRSLLNLLHRAPGAESTSKK